jgi:hypothetical protein
VSWDRAFPDRAARDGDYFAKPLIIAAFKGHLKAGMRLPSMACAVCPCKIGWGLRCAGLCERPCWLWLQRDGYEVKAGWPGGLWLQKKLETLLGNTGRQLDGDAVLDADE